MAKKETSKKDTKVVEFPKKEEKEVKGTIIEENVVHMNPEDEGTPVTREEVVDIITQIVNNVNQMADLLMKDVNIMYANHVFPFQMRVAAMEEILIEKGITTESEINDKVNARIEALQKQAKEIKEQESEKE